MGSWGIWISAGGIRSDAGACAFADQRTEERHAIDGAANVKAARVTKDAKETEADLPEVTAAGVCGVGDQPARILAGAFL